MFMLVCASAPSPMSASPAGAVSRQLLHRVEHRRRDRRDHRAVKWALCGISDAGVALPLSWVAFAAIDSALAGAHDRFTFTTKYASERQRQAAECHTGVVTFIEITVPLDRITAPLLNDGSFFRDAGQRLSQIFVVIVVLCGERCFPSRKPPGRSICGNGFNRHCWVRPGHRHQHCAVRRTAGTSAGA